MQTPGAATRRPRQGEPGMPKPSRCAVFGHAELPDWRRALARRAGSGIIPLRWLGMGKRVNTSSSRFRMSYA